MANWAEISHNAKNHGDFAGRSKTEQDAYFEFFSGAQRTARSSKWIEEMRRLCRAYHNRGMSWPLAKVAFSDHAARK